MVIPAFSISTSVPSAGRVHLGRSCSLRTRHSGGFIFASRKVNFHIAMKVSTDDPSRKKVILTEGDIVAVVRGSSDTGVELGVVTGTDSSGRNVDFVPLKPYIPELYVRDADDGSRFVRRSQVRRVHATWVEEQGGWIVLNADVEAAEREISSFDTNNINAQVLSPPPSEPREKKIVSKRDLFRPTRTQSFIGAALSIPIAATAYAVFAGERAAFVSQREGAVLDVALIIAASVSVFSLITGAALFLYGVNSPPEE